jgi:hypothetical protein
MVAGLFERFIYVLYRSSSPWKKDMAGAPIKLADIFGFLAFIR